MGQGHGLRLEIRAARQIDRPHIQMPVLREAPQHVEPDDPVHAIAVHQQDGPNAAVDGVRWVDQQPDRPDNQPQGRDQPLPEPGNQARGGRHSLLLVGRLLLRAMAHAVGPVDPCRETGQPHRNALPQATQFHPQPEQPEQGQQQVKHGDLGCPSGAGGGCTSAFHHCSAGSRRRPAGPPII